MVGSLLRLLVAANILLVSNLLLPDLVTLWVCKSAKQNNVGSSAGECERKLR